MNSITKRLMAGVAAAATLLSGMALTGSAMAADTAIATDAVQANQTLTVKASEGALKGKNLYAVKLAAYSAAQTDGADITGYDLADGGYATAVDQALKDAGIIDTTSPAGYDSTNPMTWVVQNLLDSDSSPYAGQLRNFLTKLANQQTVKTAFVDGNKMDVATDGNTATKNVPAGVYAVFDVASENGNEVVSIPMLNGTTIDGKTIKGKTLGEVDYKATQPTVGKKIVEEDSRVESNVAAIGDTVTYELTTTVPNYTGYDQGYYLALNDTLSKGLTFKEIASVRVEGIDTEYKGNTTFYKMTDLADATTEGAYNGGKSFSVLFSPTAEGSSDITKQSALFPIGKKITVRYTATLNKDAVINGDGNPNQVNLTYSRNPNGTEHGDTDNVEVKTYTGNLKLHKVDVKDNNLKGAEFEVRNAANGDALKFRDNNDGTYTLLDNQTATDGVTSLVTPDSGILTINGLNGKYYFKETKSPLGATALPSFDATVTVRDTADATDSTNKPAGSQTVSLDKADANQLVVADTDNDANIKVTNVRNITEMPKTGAAWLCIYAVMALLCGGGAFLLLRSSKKRA